MNTEEAIEIGRGMVSGLRRASGNRAAVEEWELRDRAQEHEAARRLLVGTHYAGLVDRAFGGDADAISEAGNYVRQMEESPIQWGLLICQYQV